MLWHWELHCFIVAMVFTFALLNLCLGHWPPSGKDIVYWEIQYINTMDDMFIGTCIRTTFPQKICRTSTPQTRAPIRQTATQVVATLIAHTQCKS